MRMRNIKSRLLIRIPLKPPNYDSNFKIVYAQILDRRETINFHVKPEVRNVKNRSFV